VKKAFDVPVAVAELEVVETVPDERVAVTPDEVDDIDLARVVDEEVVETTVPFKIYRESLLPAPITLIRTLYTSSRGVYVPQNSPLFPAQAMLHCVSGYNTLVLPRVFPQ
jgi:hypothetical protein